MNSRSIVVASASALAPASNWSVIAPTRNRFEVSGQTNRVARRSCGDGLVARFCSRAPLHGLVGADPSRDAQRYQHLVIWSSGHVESGH
jgi:hypothetical protein